MGHLLICIFLVCFVFVYNVNTLKECSCLLLIFFIFVSKRVLQILFYWDFLDFNKGSELPFRVRINPFHDSDQSLIA